VVVTNLKVSSHIEMDAATSRSANRSEAVDFPCHRPPFISSERVSHCSVSDMAAIFAVSQ
jgi:hypothetical protein